MLKNRNAFLPLRINPGELAFAYTYYIDMYAYVQMPILINNLIEIFYISRKKREREKEKKDSIM